MTEKDLDMTKKLGEVEINEDEIEKNEEGIPFVKIGEKSFPPLADGEYDAIILSTGLEECILAGLLAVRGKKVLQIDRNPYYGGSCASLNLKELYEKGKPSLEKDMTKIEEMLGSSRNYCVDLVPKLLMANGKLVKMLIQTGVTKYMDFNGIYGSYVYNSGRIYKLPVTPTEALTSSLVRMFQKPKLRSFADFVAKYRMPKKVANTLTKSQFTSHILDYYKLVNPTKAVENEIKELVDKFEPNDRELLVGALEDKYILSLFPTEKTVTFVEGPLGMVIEGISISSLFTEPNFAVKSFIRVKEFGQVKGKPTGQAYESKVVRLNDIMSKVNGKNILGLSETEVKQLIVKESRPLKLTFIRANNDLYSIIKHGVKSFKATMQSRKNGKDPLNLKKMTASQLMDYFGLDSDTQNFLGHGMALRTSDEYLHKSADEFVMSCQLYAHSIGRYGQSSPYLYPLYGLASLPEGFSRLAAIYGGTVMLRTDVDEILTGENGEAVGVRVKDTVAKAKIIIGDASFFPESKVTKTGKVIRSICILKDKIKGVSTKGDSAQIIIPAKHIPNKSNDVYVSMLSNSHQVSSQGIFLAIASTQVETDDPESELKVAFDLMGTIIERFDFVSDCFKENEKDTNDNCYITTSLDATSHFESAAKDIMSIYKKIFGVELDLEEKIVETQPE